MLMSADRSAKHTKLTYSLNSLDKPTTGLQQVTSGHRKFTAFGSGELHLHQVELADLQRTYGCRLRDSSKILASSNLAQLIATDSIGRPPIGADKLVVSSQQQQQPMVLHSLGQIIGWDHTSLPKNHPDDERSARLMLPCAVRLPAGRHAQRQPIGRWYFQPSNHRTSRPVPLSHLASARSIPIASYPVDSSQQQQLQQSNATKRARLATMNPSAEQNLNGQGRRETRFLVAPTHLTIEWPRRSLSGRYLYQLEDEETSGGEPNGRGVMCDINVIIRSPIKLKMAATLNFGILAGQQSMAQPVAQASTLPIDSTWLARAISWFSWPLAANTIVPDQKFNENSASLKSEQPARKRRSSIQVPASRQEDFSLRGNPLIEFSPNRVQVRGVGVLAEPPIVRVGDQLQLECRANGFPIDGVKWFRNGQAINTQSSQDFQVEISSRPLLQQVRLFGNGSVDGSNSALEEFDEERDADEDADEGDQLTDYAATELNQRLQQTAKDQETNLRPLSVLTIRQVQPKDSGFQMFECFAYNSLGEQTRAGQLVLVAERRLIDWTRAQCPLVRSPSGALKLSLAPEASDSSLSGAADSWQEQDLSAGSWPKRDDSLDGRSAQLAIFRRQNPMLRALVLEAEPVELRCPVRGSPVDAQVEWRRLGKYQSERYLGKTTICLDLY